MNLLSFEKKLSYFQKENSSLLTLAEHGLEKENLRVSSKGFVSAQPHPETLGAALTHPHLTLDFAEAQIEFVTQTFSNPQKALDELEKWQTYVVHFLNKELLWPSSMPPEITEEHDILLANFGLCEKAYEKNLYRRGLAYRSGKKMQLLSGIHYNFSFKEVFWKYLHKKLKNKLKLQDFISEQYLCICRNYLRQGWIFSYLFGTTPACDLSYVEHISSPLKRLFNQTLYAPYGTSLRMSHLGYFSKIQYQMKISYNDLDSYIKDIKKALQTPHPFYQKIGLRKKGENIQINENFLQIEAEYYSRIRPKPHPLPGQKTIEALQRGIRYFEVRNIDINPFSPLGINLDLLKFKHMFFIYCLLKESPPLSDEGAKSLCENQNKVALCGRRPHLKLFCDLLKDQLSLVEWGSKILDDMSKIASLLGPSYVKVLETQKEKIYDSNLTPSAKVLSCLKEKKLEFKDFQLRKAKEHQKVFLKHKIPQNEFEKMKSLCEKSLKELQKIESDSEDIFHGYEDMEFSTQMVLREATLRGFHIEILDRFENIIRLFDGKKEQVIKQATQTEEDNLVHYLLMENKFVTKKILREKKIPVLGGDVYPSTNEAIKKYSCYCHQSVVLKPNTANFGKGIFFVQKEDKRAFEQAAENIEKLGDQILVEPFFKGKEYRFLVIGNKVVAVALREPPKIVGDGEKNIRTLIEERNQQFSKRSHFQKAIEITNELLDMLKAYSLNLDSILPAENVLFLRKNSNVSTGGESKDMTDEMPVIYKNLALKAAQAIGAKIVGVDLMIQSLESKSVNGNAVIIELNHNPALYIHRLPSAGQKRYVEKDLLNYLFR